MKDKGHERIRDAIETGYSGLTGDAFLAGKIVNGGSRLRISKLRTALIMMTVLMLVAGVAYALVPRKYAVEDSGTWTYVDNQILYQGTEEKRPTVLLEKEGIRHMAVDPNGNTLYYITRAQGGGYTLDNVSTYGQGMYPSRHISAKYNIQDIVIDGELYLLANTSTGNGEIYWLYLYSEEIPDSKISIDGWENKNITSFAVRDNILYAYSEKTQLLSAIDLSSYTLLNEPVLAGELTAITAGYELDGEKYVLAISGEKLMGISTRTGKKLDTGVKLPADATALARNKYTVHVSDSAGMLVGTYDITDLSGVELRQLYIVDAFPGSLVYTTAEAMFHEKYPDVEIVHRWTNGGIDYKTEMMSGEPGIDIVCFQDFYTNMSPLPMLLKNGAILDITNEPEIAALREHYRDIWDLVSANGRQYGVMESVLPTLWEVDAKIAEQIGWEIPTGVWTWDEFDELIDLVIAYNETADKPVKLLMDQGGAGYAIEQFDSIYMDFYSGTTNYDSPEYLQLLERQQKLALNGLLYEDNPLIFERELDGNTLLRVHDSCGLRVMHQKTYILPPTFDVENPAYVASVMPFVINANSKMKEEAVHFLACFASVEAERQNFYLNCGQWLKDKSLYVPEDPFAVEFMGGYPSEQNEYLFNFSLEYSQPVLKIVEVWRTHFFELLPKLNAGEITPEEYAAIVQRQAEMILGE